MRQSSSRLPSLALSLALKPDEKSEFPNENPDLSHYADQAQLTRERRLKPTYFDTAELMNHVVSTKVLDVIVP